MQISATNIPLEKIGLNCLDCLRGNYHQNIIQLTLLLGKSCCNYTFALTETTLKFTYPEQIAWIGGTIGIIFYFFIFLFCHTQWITSRIKTIINRLTNIKFKICALLGRSDCGGEISEKPSLWGIEISPHGQFKY